MPQPKFDQCLLCRGQPCAGPPGERSLHSLSRASSWAHAEPLDRHSQPLSKSSAYETKVPCGQKLCAKQQFKSQTLYKTIKQWHCPDEDTAKRHHSTAGGLWSPYLPCVAAPGAWVTLPGSPNSIRLRDCKTDGHLYNKAAMAPSFLHLREDLGHEENPFLCDKRLQKASVK